MYQHKSDQKCGNWNYEIASAKRWQFLLGGKRMTGMGRAPEDVQVSPMRIWVAAGHDILAPTRRVAAWRYRCCPVSPSSQREYRSTRVAAKTMSCAAVEIIAKLLPAFQRNCQRNQCWERELTLNSERTRNASVTCPRNFPMLPVRY